MKRTLVMICTLLVGVSCERSERQEQETAPSLLPTPGVDPGSPRAEPSSMEPAINAPATAAEERLNMSGSDEPGAADTAGARAQSESEKDRAITQRVREAILAEETLSSDARNVKVSTSDRVVTLKGPVSSASEKAQLERAAARTQGVKSVDNELEIEGE